MSSIYRQFQRSLILNYLVGSSLAVLGVGGATVWMTLGVQGRQLAVIGVILLISLAIMAIAEGLLFRTHMKPIRVLFVQKKSDEGAIRAAYLRAHRLPGFGRPPNHGAPYARLYDTGTNSVDHLHVYRVAGHPVLLSACCGSGLHAHCLPACVDRVFSYRAGGKAAFGLDSQHVVECGLVRSR